MLSRRAEGIQLLRAHEEKLSCPHCAQQVTVSEEGRIACENNHSFDVAKQGYVNMLTHAVQSMYTKDLFTSRKTVLESGLYDDVQRTLASYIENGAVVLDTGCGEGTHLARICEKSGAFGIGIDLAKEGIIEAARHYKKEAWIVGDLAKSPFPAATFDAILNILSPANYDEFKRLLKPNGRVIKVVPAERYLTELRQQLFADSEKESYSNAQTVARFNEAFTHVEQQRVTTTMALTPELVPHLLNMTPMGWHRDETKDITLSHITIDVDVLIGTYK
nr:methyltransferase domain-containing protein [Caryophanon latum]